MGDGEDFDCEDDRRVFDKKADLPENLKAAPV